ncbi:hypothetical protein OSB04_024023, partial [Centaurea solstitialis]
MVVAAFYNRHGQTTSPVVASSLETNYDGGGGILAAVVMIASTVTSTNNLSLRSILEKDKLTGSNFLDWERNLMIVLRHERKWYVLEEPLGEAPPANAPAAARNAHKKHSDDLLDVACLMLATMSPDLQTGLINTNAYDMIRQLRDMFQTQARTERYDATKAFNECKMVKGTSVSDHVMKMKRHLDHLERLGHPVPLQLATDTILNSLSEDYRPFVVNYNMNNMDKTIAELHSMLKTAELNMGNKNKTKDVLMVKDGGVKKKNGQASTSKGKGPVQAIQSAPKKGKGKGKGKGKKVKPNKARTENRCFICNEIGHWRQNCPKRHEAGRNHSSTQQLRKVAVLHIQELEVSPGSYDQLLNNSYKCCRLKVAQIFDRVANIGRDPRLRLLLGINSTRRTFVGRSPVDYHQAIQQASRSWNLHFDERIKEFGFAKSEFEPCVYTKFSGSIVTFLVLYVDDILLIGNDVPTLQSVKSWLSKCFQIQSTYIDKVLKKFRMDESKKGFIPMQHGIVLSKTQCPVSSQDQDKMKSIPYASAIGSIMYVILCTRPDVAYSVSVTSRYQQNPGEPHWVALKNILKYLRRTKDMFLVFGGSEDEISVIGYSDASFQTDGDDFRSQSGYVFTLNGGAISWKSSKQDTIADSTTEAEVVASISRPIDIFCDNSGAVAQAKEPREHHKSRHVLRKYHLIREIIGRGDVRICKIPTEDKVADPLTKPLARVKHEAHANSIGMQYLDTMVTSRYQHNPGEPHWVAIKNILKYLRRTKDMFLVFGGSEDEISVTGYSDASFQTDEDDFRSQSGYVFTLNGGAISWKSSKQDTIADSTTEAEYIAAPDVAKEAVWLRNFLSDPRVVASISRPIDIFCDNSGAVAQAKEPREHHKSRHVLRKYHLIREIIGRGDVRICKIPVDDNVADPLTKPLARVKHEAHACSIGMQYLDT